MIELYIYKENKMSTNSSSMKTHYTASETSLISSSSALRTNSNYNTCSDADYETSSELLSPRTISPIEYDNVVVFNKSSIELSNNNVMENTLPTNRIVKSDNRLLEQENYIDNIMEDYWGVSQIRPIEPNLSMVKFDDNETIFLLDNDSSSSSSSSTLDDTLHGSQNSINDAIATLFDNDTMIIHQESSSSLDDEIENLEKLVNDKSIGSPTKILEDLAESVYDQESLSCWSNQIVDDKKKDLRERTKMSVASRRSLISASRKEIGLKSILLIDCELQPLNLKLSRLLAEFRATNNIMLGYSNTNDRPNEKSLKIEKNEKIIVTTTIDANEIKIVKKSDGQSQTTQSGYNVKDLESRYTLIRI